MTGVLDAARTLGDVLRGHAAARPAQIAFEMPDGRSVTFAGFNTRVNQLHHALTAQGVQAGDRVAILSRNRIEVVEVYGLAKAGLIVVPLNWRLAGSDLVRLVQHSEPKVLFVDAQHAPIVAQHRTEMPSVQQVVAFGPEYEALLAGQRTDEPTVSVEPTDIAALIYTSGTTGAPKGVALTHAGVLGNARTSAGEMLQLTEADRTLAVMPLFHAGGMWYHLFPSYATGCWTLLLAEFDPAVVLETLQARRITNVHLVPTMIAALLARPEAASADLSHVRLLFYAASSIPAELLRRAMHTFPRCGFAQAYGSTEGGTLTVLTPEDHRRASQPGQDHLLLSCGRPFQGREVRLIDDAGHDVPPGQIGELAVRTPDRMLAYWHDDTATRQVLQPDGWLKTGDLGHRDAQGYLYIVDRKNDMIVTGGENVYPNEVEAALYADPDVLEAAVFGIPDPQWVEKVVAAVVLRPGADVTAQALLQRLRDRLAPYKCPKTLHFTSTLPKSAVGKVLRKALRSQYAVKPAPGPTP